MEFHILISAKLHAILNKSLKNSFERIIKLEVSNKFLVAMYTKTKKKSISKEIGKHIQYEKGRSTKKIKVWELGVETCRQEN